MNNVPETVSGGGKKKKDFNCLIQKFTSRVTFENPDLFFCQVVFDWSACISAEQTKM